MRKKLQNTIYIQNIEIDTNLSIGGSPIKAHLSGLFVQLSFFADLRRPS